MSALASVEVMAALPGEVRPSHRDLLVALADARMATAPEALRTAATALVCVTEARMAVGADPHAVRATIEATTAALAGGGQVPDDLAEKVGAIAEATARAQAFATVLLGVSNNLTAAYTAAAMSNADAVLAGPLRTYLAELMARHAALVEAAGGRDFTDPGAFVGAPRAASDAWFAIDDLAVDYAWLRRTQETVLDGSATYDEALARTIGQGWHEVTHVGGYSDYPTQPRARFLRALLSVPVVRTSGEMGAAKLGRRGEPEERRTEEITVHHEAPQPARRIDVPIG